jgi:HAE1 family hydrophobic/amphiphilic exporter-1
MAWMMSLVIVLFGWLSFDRIGLDSYPDVTFPMLSVTTLYPGANPEIIDRSITQVLEAKLNAIDGLTHIQGRSLTGASQIFLTFDLKKDIDVAFNELQVKVNQALNLLPKEIRTPQISKMEAGSAPILWLSLQGDRTDDQLYDLANNVVKKSLETLEGVGEVVIGGYQERSVQVALNINRLNALHLSVVDVIRAFQHEHIQLPGGQLTHLDQEFLVKLDAEFHDLETLKAMPIVQRGATVITLKDIADVHYGAGKRRQLARFNGEPTLAVGLVKLSGSNTVHIIQNALQRVEEVVLPQLPTGVSLQIASNRASFIEKIIHSLEEHLVIGTLITALIIWLFLRSFRATAIISIAIPVSLLGAVWAMHLNGYTFNTMTLLAMLLLIGVVVDDAIVVLENIHRHMENWQNEHKKPLDGAARQAVSATATHQVMTAVIASTLTLVVIFSAVLFMEGIIGRFFKEFGLVVTVGVLISMWVSLTLIPMLSAHYLNTHQITNSFILNGFHKLFDWLERFYLKMLRWVLSAPKKILAAAILLFVASLGLVPLLGASFLPEQNQDSFIVNFKTPFGSSLSYTEKRLNVLENFIQKQPEVRTTFSTIGGGSAGKVNEGRIIVNLHPVGERQASMRQIMDRLSAHFAEIPGVKAYPSQVPMMSGQRGEPLRFVLQGDRLEELETLSHQLLKRLQNVPQLGGVDLELALNQPQIGFKIDRKKAASLGLTTQSIAQTINVLVGGSTIAKFSPDTGNSDRYDIRLNADAGEINQQSDFSKIFIKSQTGHLVSLDTVAQVISEPGAAVVPRYDLKYASYFYATPKVSLNKAVVLVQEQTDFLPKGYSVKMSGQAEELKKTSRFVKLALIMAVLLVYMVLASQFNHFWQPLLIMLTQPLAIIGGIFALWWADMTLNIFSMIGLLLLMGLVAKNGILLVDLTNQLRQEGKSPKEALLEACPVRLRPVLMTSLTVIVTMLPAALGLGAGNEANAPLSVAVIGGMISSTFLTLLVIPAAYLLMAKVQPNSVSIKEAIQSFIRICPGTSVWQRFRPSWRKAD